MKKSVKSSSYVDKTDESSWKHVDEDDGSSSSIHSLQLEDVNDISFYTGIDDLNATVSEYGSMNSMNMNSLVVSSLLASPTVVSSRCEMNSMETNPSNTLNSRNSPTPVSISSVKASNDLKIEIDNDHHVKTSRISNLTSDISKLSALDKANNGNLKIEKETSRNLKSDNDGKKLEKINEEGDGMGLEVDETKVLKVPRQSITSKDESGDRFVSISPSANGIFGSNFSSAANSPLPNSGLSDSPLNGLITT